jgi:hypothetical protein
LSEHWYGGGSKDWQVIPLLRNPVDVSNEQKASARSILGLHSDQYIVCSFGLLGRTKLNQRLLDAWLSSRFATDERCVLIFVGENEAGEYGASLKRAITENGCSARVKITGWADTIQYERHLHAADVGVQLRSMSRGETSAAVLDCMNYGISTVINANGSMADIPDEVVCKLPDEFVDSELTAALEFLYAHPEERQALARRAQEFLHTAHAPDHCAYEYAQSIELFYRKNTFSLRSLMLPLAQALPANSSAEQLKELSLALTLSFPSQRASRILFLDVSVVACDDFKTGIQRVVRALTLALIAAPPQGYRIEPVYLSEDHGAWHYRYARDFTLGLLK